MRLRHAALLTVTALLIGGCGAGSSTNTNTQSGNGGPGFNTAPFRPLFQSVQGILPYPTDLLLNGSTDGTVKAPVLSVTPNVTSLNALDGFGVNTEMTIRFSKKVDAASLAIPGALVVLETTQRTVVASASSIARVPTAVRRLLVQGIDYSVGLSTASDADGTVVSIKPLKPLTSSRGGAVSGGAAGLIDETGVGYLVLVTNAVKSTDGDHAAPDDEFLVIRNAIDNPPNIANPAAHCDALGDGTLTPVCRLLAPSLALAQTTGITLQTIALAFSFTTESTRDTLEQMASTVLAGPAPVLTAQVLHNPITELDLNDKDILDPAGQNSDLVGDATLYAGTITLPYYQATPADATSTELAPALTAQWQSGTAMTLVPGRPGSQRITRYNPLPAARHTVAVPVLITLPNNRTAPSTGWPVVIFVHGITGNRTNLLEISEAYAEMGYAVAAIDLPLHGITPTDPAAALRISGVQERTFDMDVVNNTTGLPGADGIVDGSGAHFIQVTSPITTRDNLREAIIDELALARALAAPTTVLVTDAGPLLAPFDPTRIQLAGHSLGGIVGATVASLPSNIHSFALSAAGGGIADLLLQSATFGPPIRSAVATKFADNTFLFNRLFDDAQAALDAGDPINHIALAVQNKPLLFHKILNDQVMPNSATDRLTLLSGVPRYTNPGFWFGSGSVTFTAGAHTSLLDESVARLVTVEMQSEFATFAYLMGDAVEITDTTYIQP